MLYSKAKVIREVMMRKQLLFVTYENEDLDEGLNYAIDLAKTMGKDIAILVATNKRTLKEKFDDLMSAVTFAEANEYETARGILSSGGKTAGIFEDKVERLAEMCQRSGVGVNIHSVKVDLFSAIKDFLREKTGIDMVLLSPSVTDNGNVSSRELNKLVRTASRPVVTMAKQTLAPAH